MCNLIILFLKGPIAHRMCAYLYFNCSPSVAVQKPLPDVYIF